MFVPYTNSIKNTFIVPTDAHFYKIIEMLKLLSPLWTARLHNRLICRH